jgi:hypothetical protein
VPGSITISLSREAGHATWTGYRVLAGLAGFVIPEQRVRDTTYLIYTAVKSSLPRGGLVAVMYVPGEGCFVKRPRFAIIDLHHPSMQVPDKMLPAAKIMRELKSSGQGKHPQY